VSTVYAVHKHLVRSEMKLVMKCTKLRPSVNLPDSTASVPLSLVLKDDADDDEYALNLQDM
jgi:hypothetical protein